VSRLNPKREIYGGFAVTTSNVSSPYHPSFPRSRCASSNNAALDARTSPEAKRACALERGGELCVVLRRARASAVGEISIPVTVVLRVGERRERRRRGMQPVPVQRSRMRICFGSVRREGVESRIEERR
jgi:hypothetical protein